ncbi:metallophosphoesterase family protein [Cognatishimia sp. WU-CL00825]|uniref:metallophosphoesterase family protein n=1 Tax=Cognatishimia sp. WU-CL00825 TaxID=3127658 RepID=UPI0033655B3A
MFFKKLQGALSGAASEAETAPLHLAHDFVVIGDLHGRADLLEGLLRQLETEAPGLPLVFVGDYIDRGPDSAAVLRLLQDLPGATCLMGNHERMCLSFLDQPNRNGARWLRYGGADTLASYGVAVQQDDRLRARDQLIDIMGEDSIHWMRALPLFARNGMLYVTHAGADPRQDIETQDESSLIWEHPEFVRQPRRDGAWLIHGHTIVTQPLVQQQRIAIDTGAYATGRLTAAVFAGDDLRFVQTP